MNIYQVQVIYKDIYSYNNYLYNGFFYHKKSIHVYHVTLHNNQKYKIYIDKIQVILSLYRFKSNS